MKLKKKNSVSSLFVFCTTCIVCPPAVHRNITSTHNNQIPRSGRSTYMTTTTSPLVHEHQRQVFGIGSTTTATSPLLELFTMWLEAKISSLASCSWPTMVCSGGLWFNKMKIILISKTIVHQHHFQSIVSPKLKHEHLSWLRNIISQCLNIHMLVSQQSIIELKLKNFWI